MMSTRSCPIPLYELSTPVAMVSGAPVWNCRIPLVCQPPVTYFIAPDRNGEWYLVIE